MGPMQEEITGITHPYITGLYLKHNYDRAGKAEDVLVIETDFDPSKKENGHTIPAYLDLLNDLGLLQKAAEEKVGHVDRIDIRQNHWRKSRSRFEAR